MDHLSYTISPLGLATQTWAQIYDSIYKSNESVERKQRWKKAIDFLYTELGKGFFSTCGYNHPINLKLSTNLFLIDDLVDFTDALRGLQQTDANSYLVLMEKLRPRKRCQSEGIPFSDVLRTFSKHNFRVKFLREKEGQKNADIELTDPDTGSLIFGEVSQLLQSPTQESIQHQHKTISNAFHLYGDDIPMVFKQLQNLENPELEKIVAQIKMAKVKAVANQELVIIEDDFIMMAVAHPAKLYELDEWCRKKDLQRNSILGVNVDYNDTRRLVNNRKISAEIKQLPEDHAGFVYMPVSILYFISMNVPETVISIMKEMNGFPNCIGVILYAPSVGGLLPEGILESEHVRRSVKTINGITRHFLFINNPFFTMNLLQQVKDKFRNCLY